MIKWATVTSSDYVTIGYHLLRMVGPTFEEYVDIGEISFEAIIGTPVSRYPTDAVPRGRT